MTKISNTNIHEIKPLLSPEMVLHDLPMNDKIRIHVQSGRQQLEAIIKGEDKRLIAIVGPCSVHEKDAALDYARKLKVVAEAMKDKLCIVMRVYFEKPRTTVGWKGLINDPYLDNSFNINAGLKLARELLLEINTLGLFAATEFVDTFTPQYIADLISWAAIGARTVESQPHRMLASGLSMPVGFKNSTTGDVEVAANAVAAATNPHRFLGVTQNGLAAIVNTKGNDNCHIVLRGGKSGTNYSAEHVNMAAALLAKHHLPQGIMIDCSHGNSNKDFRRQADVVDAICKQLLQGSSHIMGLMIESNLLEGRQDFEPGAKLVYGKSITDACIGWEQTEILLNTLAEKVNIGG
ncbi:MAG: 3-deoxy-7-phosphoheptulonate synthase [Pseudomonadota bacterium]